MPRPKSRQRNSRPRQYTRPPWERMMRIHTLLRANAFPNCSDIAHEFELCRRTVLRDLEFMKSNLGLPLAFDSVRNGFYYTEPVSHFPGLPVNESEMFALLVAHKAIAQYRGTPFERPLERAFRKLTGQLDKGARFSLGSLEEVLSFRPFAPGDADLEVFEVVSRGLQESRALKFLYRNAGVRKASWREVRPYHLACVENNWYLFAYDVDRGDMRTFVLTRLRRPELLRARFTRPKVFNPSEYLRGSFSVFKGAADYEVVIDFDPWAADLVRGRRWHDSQEVTDLPNGALRLRMRLNSLEEAERWVLSWGTHATVVRPQTLADRLACAAVELARRYG